MAHGMFTVSGAGARLVKRVSGELQAVCAPLSTLSVNSKSSVNGR